MEKGTRRAGPGEGDAPRVPSPRPQAGPVPTRLGRDLQQLRPRPRLSPRREKPELRKPPGSGSPLVFEALPAGRAAACLGGSGNKLGLPGVTFLKGLNICGGPSSPGPGWGPNSKWICREAGEGLSPSSLGWAWALIFSDFFFSVLFLQASGGQQGCE